MKNEVLKCHGNLRNRDHYPQSFDRINLLLREAHTGVDLKILNGNHDIMTKLLKTKTNYLLYKNI
jgi:hypothetical protein